MPRMRWLGAFTALAVNTPSGRIERGQYARNAQGRIFVTDENDLRANGTPKPGVVEVQFTGGERAWDVFQSADRSIVYVETTLAEYDRHRTIANNPQPVRDEP